LQLRLLCDLSPALHHAVLLVRRRIANEKLEQEAVRLRFRQRVGALLLDRILRRHDQKGRGQDVGLAAERHLPLLHGLEEGTLHLRRCTVDLVGENEVGKDRTEVHGELGALRLEDHGADDVARQQIGGELNPFELQADRRAQAPHEQGLREARKPLEQDMSVSEQRNQHALDHRILADDRFAHLGTNPLGPVLAAIQHDRAAHLIEVERSGRLSMTATTVAGVRGMNFHELRVLLRLCLFRMATDVPGRRETQNG
jgi:hypothetical protein